MNTQFLGIDVILHSSVDLTPLSLRFEEVDSDLQVGFCGPAHGGHQLNLSLGEWDDEPNSAANALCDILEGLEPVTRGMWDAATKRVFDVGLRPSRTHGQPLSLFEPQTLQRLVTLGVQVAVTVYETNSPEH